jgi:hypothetical protein
MAIAPRLADRRLISPILSDGVSASDFGAAALEVGAFDVGADQA